MIFNGIELKKITKKNKVHGNSRNKNMVTFVTKKRVNFFYGNGKAG